MRTFDPWIGTKYPTEGLNGIRLLILGESHYGTPGDEYAEFTGDVVTEWGQEKRHAFFTKVAKLGLTLESEAWLPDRERSEFWEHVAFYNFIQVFLRQPRERPSPEMWEAAKPSLLELLSELQPHVLLVLGADLRSHLPTLPAELRVCYSDHPSFSGFSYEPAATQLRNLLVQARDAVA